ncbi:MAG: hypothetical protein H0U89_10390 [Acidimicrobiia bacterium]|nr:hypothetical protein [Acidimicrobiia bacterium]
MPEVWGEFEVDCTTNTTVGVRQRLVDDLTRAYPRAAPGRLTARATARPRRCVEPLSLLPSSY